MSNVELYLLKFHDKRAILPPQRIGTSCAFGALRIPLRSKN